MQVGINILRKCEMRKCILDQRQVQAAVSEYLAGRRHAVTWSEILEERGTVIPERAVKELQKTDPHTRRSVLENLLSRPENRAWKWFESLDPDNRPDICRFINRTEHILSCCEEISMGDFQYVSEEDMRIIIEENAACPDLPLVYVRSGSGENTDLSEYEPELSCLLCMDICVTDPGIRDPGQILAILVFYMEYPIRAKRIQREGLMRELVKNMRRREEGTGK